MSTLICTRTHNLVVVVGNSSVLTLPSVDSVSSVFVNLCYNSLVMFYIFRYENNISLSGNYAIIYDSVT